MRLWERIKVYAKLLLFGALAYYILRAVSFAEKQAVVLAVFVAFVVNVGLIMRHEARDRFEPFSMTFHPNWFIILTEQGIIKDEEYRKRKSNRIYLETWQA